MRVFKTSIMKVTLLLLFPFVLALSVSANNVEKRVSFVRGASSATVKGRWFKDPKARGETFDRYLLGAAKGQKMTVKVTSTATSSLFIWTKDYNNGPNWTAEGTGYTKTFQLPNNGDYNVDIGPSDPAEEFDYTMTMTIK